MLISREKKDQLFNLFDLTDLGLMFFCEYNAFDILHFDSVFSDNYTYETGASKFVLIPKDSKEKYVIKIPYQGYRENYENDDGFFTSYDYTYEGSEDSCNGWDDCEGEVYRYCFAKQENMKKYFAKMELLGYVNDYPIYIQKRCVLFGDVRDSTPRDKRRTREEQKTILKQYYNKSQIDADWLISFKFYYGEKQLSNFLSFVTSMEWDDDLHCQNIGYLGNHPVVVDYGSFNE